MNWTFEGGDTIKKLKDVVAEACQRVEAIEVVSKHLGEVLSKMKVELAKVKADRASEKGRMKLEVAKAKMELVEARKEAVKVMERYKAFKDFVVEKAWVVADF